MKPQKKNANKERLVQALEGLVADYRAGKGDVFSRIAEGSDPHDEGDLSLESVLTLALFGSRAVPGIPNGGGSLICTKAAPVERFQTF